MNNSLYIVGVGPGDPELLTVKAIRLLDRCPVWLAPAGSDTGASTALAIVTQAVDKAGHEILTRHFPMMKIRQGQAPDPLVAAAWRRAAAAVLDRLRQGLDVAFPTLGDPAVYSTGFYLCDTLLSLEPAARITVVPGVSSMGAAAAAAMRPLCLGDDRVAVLPATFENGLLRETLENFDTVVLMKVHRVMDRIVFLLRDMDLLQRAVLVERTGQDGERIHHDLAAAARSGVHYFSTVIVRKR